MSDKDKLISIEKDIDDIARALGLCNKLSANSNSLNITIDSILERLNEMKELINE